MKEIHTATFLLGTHYYLLETDKKEKQKKKRSDIKFSCSILLNINSPYMSPAMRNALRWIYIKDHFAKNVFAFV